MNRISTMKQLGFLIAMIALVSTTLNAQSPRISIIEEATNASCGPCAAQNPYFEAFLNLSHVQRTIIPICYHSNWPGSTEIMNNNDALMHNGRVSYYGVSGVPTAVVNGNMYSGGPANTGAMERASKSQGTTSPITMSVLETRNGDNVNINVTVSSITPVVNMKLRIVAVEQHHYYANAGNNGEKDFYYVARKMLPDLNGTTINLNAGEMKSFTQSYTINTVDWNADQMYTVAFIQNDATKEILQAAQPDSKAQVLLNAINPTTVQPAIGAPKEWAGFATTNKPGKYAVTITNALPGGWTSSVKVDNQSVKSGDSLTLSSAPEGIPINVNIQPSGSKLTFGKVDVMLKMGELETVETFKLYSTGADALVIVKDEGGVPTIPDRYDKGMAKVASMPYLLVENGDEGAFNWKDYKVIVYEVGKGVVVKEDVDMLKSYMDNGGRLFLTGAEIAWGLADAGATGYYQDAAFLTNYLHCGYVGDTGPNFTIYGGSGDPIGNGMQFSIASGVHTGTNNTPDVLSARPESKAFLYYGPEANKSVAGIRYSNPNYRLVYMGFGLEEITDDNVRGTLLQRGIDWLLGSEITSGVRNETVTIGDMTVEGIRPNPAGNTVELPFSLVTPAHVSVNVYNAQGSLIGSATDKNYEAGHSVVRYNVSTLPTGVYSFVVTVNGKNTVRQVTVTH